MFGSKHRAEKRAAEEAAHYQRNKAQLRQAIVNLIALAQGQDSTDPDWPLVLRPGERLFSTLTGGGLFEPRRDQGHWSGRSAGVSIPTGVAGIRVRVGKSAGTYIQGVETPTVIDAGNASITSERVVFQGEKYTREWDYSKLIGIIHYSDKPATAIQVSNRQKTSGIVYAGVASTEPIRLALTVAVAVFRGETEETIKELQDELAALDSPSDSTANSPKATANEDTSAYPATTTGPADKPPPAATTSLPSQTRVAHEAKAVPPPPRWAKDPTGRHEFRYWDGTTWTDYVADNGSEARDPLPSDTTSH
jgi:hypothetical protein